MKSGATSLFDVRRSMFDVGRSSFNMFDVGRSMFNVRRSSFKTIPYGINVTCERLQNNLALMGSLAVADEVLSTTRFRVYASHQLMLHERGMI